MKHGSKFFYYEYPVNLRHLWKGIKYGDFAKCVFCVIGDDRVVFFTDSLTRWIIWYLNLNWFCISEFNPRAHCESVFYVCLDLLCWNFVQFCTCFDKGSVGGCVVFPVIIYFGGYFYVRGMVSSWNELTFILSLPTFWKSLYRNCFILFCF